MQASKQGRYVATSCPICLDDFTSSDSADGAPAQCSTSQPDATNESMPLLNDQDNPSEVAPVPSAPPAPGHTLTPPAATSPSRAADTSAIPAAAASFRAPESDKREPFMLPCGHTFCEPCISEWLKRHGECPGAPPYPRAASQQHRAAIGAVGAVV